MNYPSSLLINESNNNQIIVCNTYNHCLTIFNEEGEFIQNIGGKKGNNFNQFNHLNSISINSKNELIIADSKNERIQILNGSTFDFLFNFKNEQNLGNYFHLTINNFDQIIISDYENHNIQLYENDGKFINKFGKSLGRRLPKFFDWIQRKKFFLEIGLSYSA